MWVGLLNYHISSIIFSVKEIANSSANSQFLLSAGSLFSDFFPVISSTDL